MSVQAGVQFSLPLIDFSTMALTAIASWGSVLITPDRLRYSQRVYECWLGFSSHYP